MLFYLALWNKMSIFALDVYPATCGGEYYATDDPQYFASPGYYRPGFRTEMTCTWIIRTDPGYSIQMNYTEDFQLSYSCSRSGSVSLYDVVDNGMC